jgi:hypothetical protein
MEYCKRLCYTSTLFSEYYFKRVLHPFRDFFKTKTFSRYYCIQWGILWQSNVTSSQRNTPPFPQKCQLPSAPVFGLPGKVWGKSKDCGGMSQWIGTQWLGNFFNPASLDSRFTIQDSRSRKSFLNPNFLNLESGENGSKQFFLSLESWIPGSVETVGWQQSAKKQFLTSKRWSKFKSHEYPKTTVQIPAYLLKR